MIFLYQNSGLDWVNYELLPHQQDLLSKEKETAYFISTNTVCGLWKWRQWLSWISCMEFSINLPGKTVCVRWSCLACSQDDCSSLQHILYLHSFTGDFQHASFSLLNTFEKALRIHAWSFKAEDLGFGCCLIRLLALLSPSRPKHLAPGTRIVVKGCI